MLISRNAGKPARITALCQTATRVDASKIGESPPLTAVPVAAGATRHVPSRPRPVVPEGGDDKAGRRRVVPEAGHAVGGATVEAGHAAGRRRVVPEVGH